MDFKELGRRALFQTEMLATILENGEPSPDSEFTDTKRRALTYPVLDREPIADHLNDYTLEEVFYLCYVYHQIVSHADEYPLEQDFYREEAAKVYAYLAAALRNAEKVYVIFSSATRHPFIFDHGEKFYAVASTKEEHVQSMVKLLEEKGLSINVQEIPGEAFSVFMHSLRFMGLTHVEYGSVDYKTRIKLEDLAEFAVNENPSLYIENPSFQQKALMFFQFINSGMAPQMMQKMEFEMMHEIFTARYILPSSFDPELLKAEHELSGAVLDRVQFATLENQEKKAFQPLLTDWVEMNKFNQHGQYKALVLEYNDLKKIFPREGVDAVVFNPMGTNISLTAEQLTALEEKYHTVLQLMREAREKGEAEQRNTSEQA
ncbi:MAG: SseB family protein [Lachnospiraceae bacterium]|nr:SseB family protein [Lachnospiraceae bacterium]MDY5742917.1 SseB family protein [Lachnospiraceae bacterium]